MEKSIVKSFLGNAGDDIYIVSENSMAVAYTGKEYCKIRTELGIYYAGWTLLIDSKDLRSKKAALELFDAERIKLDEDGKTFKIGNMLGIVKDKSDEIPNFSDFSGTDFGTFRFSGEEIKRLIHLAGCASTEENHLFMNGVFFAENGEIASTDAYRLCVWKTAGKYPKIIIHRDAFKPFRKSKKITITVKGDGIRMVEISDGKTTVRTAEIDGTFPNYSMVIPDKRGYAEAEGVSMDFKKYGAYISSTGTKYFPAHLQLFNDAVYCNDIQVGYLGFNIDPLVIDARYFQEAIENVGGKIAWRKVGQDEIDKEVGLTEETPYVKKALIFGNDSYFDVVMPSTLNDDIVTSTAFKNAVERISRKSA